MTVVAAAGSDCVEVVAEDVEWHAEG